MRTATIGNSLMGLLEASSVVVAANCFSAGCNSKNSNKSVRKCVYHFHFVIFSFLILSVMLFIQKSRFNVTTF